MRTTHPLHPSWLVWYCNVIAVYKDKTKMRWMRHRTIILVNAIIYFNCIIAIATTIRDTTTTIQVSHPHSHSSSSTTTDYYTTSHNLCSFFFIVLSNFISSSGTACPACLITCCNSPASVNPKIDLAYLLYLQIHFLCHCCILIVIRCFF